METLFSQPVPTISDSALALMGRMCETRYQQLISDGCGEDVAADRTYDALRAACGEVPHCYDSRDRLFEDKLRNVAERNANA